MTAAQVQRLRMQLHAVAIFLKDQGHEEHADIVEQGVIYIEENEDRMDEAKDALSKLIYKPKSKKAES